VALTADVQFREQYASHALNRKLAGVTEPGVYWGFEVAPAGGMAVSIGIGDDPDYPWSVAVVERDGFSLTCRMDTEEQLDVPEAGKGYDVVLEASYVLGQETEARLKLTPSAADHHVVLARLDVPADATAIADDMIDTNVRQVGHPAHMLMQLLTQITTLTEDLTDTRARLTALEAWAKENGFSTEL